MSTESIIQALNSQIERLFLGPQEQQITAALAQNPTADTAATIVHDTIMAIDEQAATRGTPLDIDVLLPVATEAIDLLVEILMAMGQEIGDENQFREETLLKIAILHMQSVEGDPEAKAAAQELVAALSDSGDMQRSMQHITQAAGASPEQMQAAGAQMATPQQRPVAAGVQRGLMQPQ